MIKLISGQLKTEKAEKKAVASQEKMGLNLIIPKESKREVVHGN